MFTPARGVQLSVLARRRELFTSFHRFLRCVRRECLSRECRCATPPLLGVPETLALLPAIRAMNDAMGIAGEGSLLDQVAKLLAAMGMAATCS